MKLTNKQLSKLLNQHTGTGYLVVKTGENNIRIVSVNMGNKYRWFAGAKTLGDYMGDLSGEVRASDEAAHWDNQ